MRARNWSWFLVVSTNEWVECKALHSRKPGMHLGEARTDPPGRSSMLPTAPEPWTDLDRLVAFYGIIGSLSLAALLVRSAQVHCRRRPLCIVTLNLKCIKHGVRHGICMVQTPQPLCWRSSCCFLARAIYLFTCSILTFPAIHVLAMPGQMWEPYQYLICLLFSISLHFLTCVTEEFEISGVFLSIALAIQLNRLCPDRIDRRFASCWLLLRGWFQCCPDMSWSSGPPQDSPLQ